MIIFKKKMCLIICLLKHIKTAYIGPTAQTNMADRSTVLAHKLLMLPVFKSDRTILSCLILSYLVVFYFILSYLSYLILFNLILSYFILLYLILYYFILFYLILSYVILFYLILSYFILFYLIFYLILSCLILSNITLNYIVNLIKSNTGNDLKKCGGTYHTKRRQT